MTDRESEDILEEHGRQPARPALTGHLLEAAGLLPDSHHPATGLEYGFEPVAGATSDAWHRRIGSKAAATKVCCTDHLGDGGRAWVYGCTVRSGDESVRFEEVEELAVKVFREAEGQEWENEARLLAIFSETEASIRPRSPRFLANGWLLHHPSGRRMPAIVMERLGTRSSSTSHLPAFSTSMASNATEACESIANDLDLAASIAESMGILCSAFKRANSGRDGAHGDLKEANVFIFSPANGKPVAVIADHGSWRDAAAAPTQFTIDVPVTDSAAIGRILRRLLDELPSDARRSEAYREAMVQLASLQRPDPPPMAAIAGNLAAASRRIRKPTGNAWKRRFAVAALALLAAAASWYGRQEFLLAAAVQDAARRFEEATTESDWNAMGTVIRSVEEISEHARTMARLLPGYPKLPPAEDVKDAQAWVVCMQALTANTEEDRRATALKLMALPEWKTIDRKGDATWARKVTEQAERVLSRSIEADAAKVASLKSRLSQADERQATAEIAELEGLALPGPSFSSLAPSAWESHSGNCGAARRLLDELRYELDLVRGVAAERQQALNAVSDPRSSAEMVSRAADRLEDRLRPIRGLTPPELLRLIAELKGESEALIAESRDACRAWTAAEGLGQGASAQLLDECLRKLRSNPARQRWLEPCCAALELRRKDATALESWLRDADHFISRFVSGRPERIPDPEAQLGQLEGEFDRCSRSSASALAERSRERAELLHQIQGALSAVRLCAAYLRTAMQGDDPPPVDQGSFDAMESLRKDRWDWDGFQVQRSRLQKEMLAFVRHAEATAASARDIEAVAVGLERVRITTTPVRQPLPAEYAELDSAVRQIVQIASAESLLRDIADGFRLASTAEDLAAAKAALGNIDVRTPRSVLRERVLSRVIDVRDQLSNEIERAGAAMSLEQGIEMNHNASTEDLERLCAMIQPSVGYNNYLRQRLGEWESALDSSKSLDEFDRNLAKLESDIANADPRLAPAGLPAMLGELPMTKANCLEVRRDKCAKRLKLIRDEHSMLSRAGACARRFRADQAATADCQEAQWVLAQAGVPRHSQCAELVRRSIDEWMKLPGAPIPDTAKLQSRRECTKCMLDTPSEHLGVELLDELREHAEQLDALDVQRRTIEREWLALGRITPGSAAVVRIKAISLALNSLSKGARDWHDSIEGLRDRLQRDSLEVARKLIGHLEDCATEAQRTPDRDAAKAGEIAKWFADVRSHVPRGTPLAILDEKLRDSLGYAEASARKSQLDWEWRRLRENYDWWTGGEHAPQDQLTAGEFRNLCKDWLGVCEGISLDDGQTVGAQRRDHIDAVRQALDAVSGPWVVWCEQPTFSEDNGQSSGSSGILKNSPRFLITSRDPSFVQAPAPLDVEVPGPIEVGTWTAPIGEKLTLAPIWSNGNYVSWGKLLWGWDPALTTFNGEDRQVDLSVDPGEVILGGNQRHEAQLLLPDKIRCRFLIYFRMKHAEPDRGNRSLLGEAQHTPAAAPGSLRQNNHR